jgi:hypothetical protein
MDFSEKARGLIREQIIDWDLAARNYRGLKKVKIKRFDFLNFHIDVQFNPERIISSSAKVDPLSIEARPCFLCSQNLPAQQRGLPFEDDYLVLVNPFPIFPEHLTIPALIHTDQRIVNNFGRMLDLSSRLNEFVIFYNGPKCGASAPDHLHFQAGIKGFLPFEHDFRNEKCCREVRRIGKVTLSHWPDYQRGIITLSSKDKAGLVDVFMQIYNLLHDERPEETEPMLNILTAFEGDSWQVHIFPRILHRPSQYFAPGEKQILLSPASVDMGGVLITPREEDFIKVTKEDAVNIFGQVCADPVDVLKLIKQL